MKLGQSPALEEEASLQCTNGSNLQILGAVSSRRIGEIATQEDLNTAIPKENYFWGDLVIVEINNTFVYAIVGKIFPNARFADEDMYGLCILENGQIKLTKAYRITEIKQVVEG